MDYLHGESAIPRGEFTIRHGGFHITLPLVPDLVKVLYMSFILVK
jgi:hypothetical protein